MIINLSPIRSDATLELAKTGQTLSVNGETFDFSPLPAGATLPHDAIGSDWFIGDGDRAEDGTLTLHLFLPIGANASEAARFPKPIIVEEDGPIKLPE